MGEGIPKTGPTGLAFWSRPADDKPPHLHLDDWNDEFGVLIHYSTHGDVAFLIKTTQLRQPRSCWIRARSAMTTRTIWPAGTWPVSPRPSAAGNDGSGGKSRYSLF